MNTNRRVAHLPPRTSNIKKKAPTHAPTSDSLFVKIGINIGVALEYYDFMIYVLLMPFIMPLFFQNNDPLIGTAKAFSVFALGYLARPLGGILFGQLADRKGRRNAFTGAMFLMGFSTFFIGLLPTHLLFDTPYSALPALLLIACRLAQGLSFGAELPGAITITSENNEQDTRATNCAFVISSTSIGAVFATGVIALLTCTVSPADISNWGWRIPFLLGGTLAFISWYLRKNMTETGAFSEIQSHQEKRKAWTPLLEVITHYPVSMLIGIGLVLLPAAMVITNLFFASHLVIKYDFEASAVYSSMTIALITSAFLVPFFGFLSDYCGIKTLFILTCAIFSIACSHLFSILEYHTYAGVLSFFILWQVFLCASISCVFPWLTHLFPAHVRFTGVSLCYNVGYVICAFLPNLYTCLNVNTLNSRIISNILCGIALAGLISALLSKHKNKNI